MGKHSKESIPVVAEPGDAVIASFTNSGTISNDVTFDVFAAKGKKMILHGESKNDELQYDAEELDDSQYLIGIYDSSNKKIKLVPSSKMFSGRVQSNSSLINDAKLVKKLKRKDLSEEGTFVERRNALGEEFGTKKAKKAINDAARNRIDAAMLEDSQLDIVDGIRESTKSIPDRNEMAKMVEKENRVIPKFHEDATNVEDIYPIEEIVPDDILSVFPVDIFFKPIESDEDSDDKKDELLTKLEYLPYVPGKDRGLAHQKKSIFGRLIKSLLSESSNGNINEDLRWKAQLVSFTSMLIGLYFNRRLSKREKLIESFTNLPPARGINYMLALFGDSKRNNFNYDRDIKFYTIGPKEEDKLLCHIIVLLLKLFDYRLELSSLAADLSLKPSRLLTLVRTLGCTVVVANKGDGKENAGSKFATLKVPFKVPEIARRFRR
ncbi:uncharacterized protein C5L36_0E00460 [Pichia kudriavzevii]|uniref:DNA-directed RNA polymerase I subunit RPA49 n=1 Tax=Pichia kudriavzevii TaxID=4909 RepID=A0A1V2LUX1_PICKU|nr:uncharacterized protein C5L36_0E00460 [Pichia kudriavzevii]AWU77977.1 hypothetical protein C5L36_0E00460 [Pichia kudriavzevii]ONH77778.1 DNA-directed RNA polymerase I subunit RPA49 [Pichia kudriavzevii]